MEKTNTTNRTERHHKERKGKRKCSINRQKDPSPTKAQIRDAQRNVVQEIRKTASEVLNNNKWKVLASDEESSKRAEYDSEHGEGEERPPKVTPRSADEII